MPLFSPRRLLSNRATVSFGRSPLSSSDLSIYHGPLGDLRAYFPCELLLEQLSLDPPIWRLRSFVTTFPLRGLRQSGRSSMHR
jgi:hypothetical protein